MILLLDQLYVWLWPFTAPVESQNSHLLTCLKWNPVGWANQWDGKESGVFDFAGGTVVHIVSATTSLVYSMWCKWRRQLFRKTRLTEHQIVNEIRRSSHPHNVINVLLGTTFLYVGWFGFNGGSVS